MKTKTFAYNSNCTIHSNINTLGIRQISSQSLSKCNIKPWFLTGFTDAEGCFMINILKMPQLRVGWRVQPVFQIGLHYKDKELLELIQVYFGGLGIFTKLNDNALVYRISGVEQLSKVIEQFENYPLQTQKRSDFYLFKSVVSIMKCGKHLNAEGLHEIVNLKASLNNGLTRLLKESFPNFIPEARLPEVDSIQVPDPNWLAGFTSGEGCFSIYMVKNSSYNTGYSVNLKFQISQHLRDENLLRSFVNYFGCGKYYRLDGVQRRGDFTVTRLDDILKKINPFFMNYTILCTKAKSFQYWREASELLLQKEHLNLEGLERIRMIKTNINKTLNVSKPKQ